MGRTASKVSTPETDKLIKELNDSIINLNKNINDFKESNKKTISKLDESTKISSVILGTVSFIMLLIAVMNMGWLYAEAYGGEKNGLKAVAVFFKTIKRNQSNQRF